MKGLYRIGRALGHLIPALALEGWDHVMTEKRNRLLRTRFRHCADDLYLASSVTVLSPQLVSIGSRCAINEFVHILGGGGVTIGSGVWIANHVSIISVTHDSDVEFIGDVPDIRKEVIIEDNVWIGSHAVILPGLRIGRSSIIAAGCVVTANVAPYSIFGGVPGMLMRWKRMDGVAAPVPGDRVEAAKAEGPLQE